MSHLCPSVSNMRVNNSNRSFVEILISLSHCMLSKYIFPFPILVLLGGNVFAEEESLSFLGPLLDDSHWNLTARSVYEQRDYLFGAKSNGGRNASLPKAQRSDYAQEWGIGLFGNFESGFTRGPVGFGFDLLGAAAQNLMGDDYRVGKIRLLPVSADGDAQSNLARGGVAIKANFSDTLLRYGEQRVKTPIFSSSDSRLLPESMKGLFVSSKELSSLTLQFGHFSGTTDRNAPTTNNPLTINYLDPKARRGNEYDLVGAVWTGVEHLALRAYQGRLNDTWMTSYLGASYERPLSAQSAIALDSHLYHTRDTGEQLIGKIRNTTGSVLASYRNAAHKVGVSYQKVNSDTPFDYVTRGAIYLNNYTQLADFNGPHEQSWKLQYDLDGTVLGMPEWALGGSYARGTGIDGSKIAADSAYAWLGYGKDGKHWERDLWLKYTVLSGRAKGTSVLLRYGVHRANAAQAELNTNQLRIAVEIPFSG